MIGVGPAALNDVSITSLLGKQFRREASRQRGGGEPAMMRRSDRSAHRLDLLLHQPIDLLQGGFIDRVTDQGIGAGEHERSRIGAGNRDTQPFHAARMCGERDRDAGERIVDGAAHPHLGIRRRRRRDRQMHRHDELIIGKCEMSATILDIDVAKRNAPAAPLAGNLHFSAKREQRWREIAGEGGMTTPTLGCNMADIAVPLQAVSV
jgi:hypothetical protein